MGEAGRDTVIPSRKDAPPRIREDASYLPLAARRPHGEQAGDGQHYRVKTWTRHRVLP